MDTLYIILTAVLIAACLPMIATILMQKKRDAGFSGSSMAGQSSEEKTHFDKTKHRTREGKLERLTKVLATLFMVLAFVISIMA